MMKLKKTMFIFLMVILIFSGTVLAGSFERTEVILPEISKQLSKLENVIGWTKLPEGHWLSRENRIPMYLSIDYEILQDHEKYSLGKDNFQLLELREMKYDTKDYYILYKHYTEGYYYYKYIEEDWNYLYYVDAYVFEKENLPIIKLEDEKAELYEIKIIAKVSKHYFNQGYGEEYLQDISEKIPASMEEGSQGALIVNALKLGDKVRFLLLEEYPYGLKAFSLISKTEEVFRNFYYETYLSSFEDFWEAN